MIGSGVLSTSDRMRSELEASRSILVSCYNEEGARHDALEE